MKYPFPTIHTIDDVLPHIKGRDEFIVAEKEGYTVINYVVSMPDTFAMVGSDDLGGAIRRECRGLTFDTHGKIISRPFHKFFNVGERVETQPHAIDVSKPHVVLEKMDGSMIRPFMYNDTFAFGTKMGVTDIANDAFEWAQNVPHLIAYLKALVSMNVTPLMEWVSPDNKIVLNYDKPDLVLLAVRENFSGKYMSHDELQGARAVMSVVPAHDSVSGSVRDYVESKRHDLDREGDIIRFDDGHMVKSKNDWYVRSHKALDMVRFDHKIVELSIHNDLDDVYPLLSPSDWSRVKSVEREFWLWHNHKLNALRSGVRAAFILLKGNKKRLALEVVPLLHQMDARFYFSAFDGKSVDTTMKDTVKSHLSSGPKYQQLLEWFRG